MSITRPSFRSARSQSGAALIIALVFLVALTLLGIAAMSGNSLQEKMAYSAGETNISFQSAETAVSAGEAWLEARIAQPIPDCVSPCGNTASIWPGRPPAPLTPEVNLANLLLDAWWDDEGRKFGYNYVEGASPVLVAGQQYTVGGTVVPFSNQRYPRYVIEELGKDPTGSLVIGGARTYTLWYYQVTGRGGAAQAGGAETMSQTVYTKGF